MSKLRLARNQLEDHLDWWASWTDLALLWAALIWTRSADSWPVLPQQEDPQRAQCFDAAHFSDVIVRQVEENKPSQMREVLDPCY